VAADTWRRLRILVGRARARQGVARVRTAFWPIVVSALAAAVAYFIAHQLLGHPFPFFAATAAWVCLGFAPDRQPRRVLELAIGVTIGIGIGDAIVHVIGSGAWQVAVVLVVSAVIARFIDAGILLTTQAGVQAVIIVLLPPSGSGGPASRLVDALVGGGVALAVAMLSPRDPRRRLALLGREGFNAVAETLTLLASGLRDRRPDASRAALVRGRAAEPALEAWHEAASNARDLARVNARAWRYVAVIDHASDQSVLTDRVMRTVRVLARRAAALTEGEHATEGFAQTVARFAVGMRDLSAATGEGRDPARARAELVHVAATLDPRSLAPDDWETQALVLLARSAVVDALEAAGADPDDARAALPEL
jgi:uncharacterized membrane protein YgaE (UPF0421/DUF939 family)